MQYLALEQPGIKDETISRISALKKLISLDLTTTNVTDTGLKSIEGLVNLQVLKLPWRTTDTGFEHIQKLVKLRQVENLHFITDRGLSYLRNATEMEDLDLLARPITDDGLRYLRGMTKLKTLDLAGTKITGAGLAYLRGMTRLQKLDLEQDNVTDAALEHLQGMTELRFAQFRWRQNRWPGPQIPTRALELGATRFPFEQPDRYGRCSASAFAEVAGPRSRGL